MSIREQIREIEVNFDSLASNAKSFSTEERKSQLAKLEQNLELLLNSPDLNKEIIKLRKTWKILQNRFSG